MRQRYIFQSSRTCYNRGMKIISDSGTEKPLDDHHSVITTVFQTYILACGPICTCLQQMIIKSNESQSSCHSNNLSCFGNLIFIFVFNYYL